MWKCAKYNNSNRCVSLCKLEMWKCVKTTIQNHHCLAQAGQWTSVCRCMRDLESSLPPLMCTLMAFLSGASNPIYINHCETAVAAFVKKYKNTEEDNLHIEKSKHRILKLFLLVQ